MEEIPKQKLGASKQFLFDSYQFSLQTKVKSITKTQDAKTQQLQTHLILDTTIYHPQGGGQPADKGYIIFSKQPDTKYTIDSAFIDKDTDELIHILKGELDIIAGDECLIEIDAEWRKLNARNHTSGHLIDQAMRELAPTWGPGKGYHFPDAPYVEYNLPSGGDTSQLDKLKESATKECNRIIESLAPEDQVVTKVVDFEEASKVVQVPEFLKGKELRLVQIDSKDWWGLCGGTHVKHLKDIGTLTITKIQKKGKRARVSYNVS